MKEDQSAPKLVVTDIDNELIGSDQTLLQLQEKSHFEKKRNFFEINVDLDS